MEDPDPHRGPCIPWKVPKGKQPQRAQVARKAPQPEEMCLRRPTRPMPIPTSKRKHVPDACLSTGSPGRKHKATSSAPPMKKAEGSACSPSGLHGGQGIAVTDTPQPAGTRLVRDATHRAQQSHNKPRSASSTHGLGHTRKPQAQAKFPAGNSPSIPRPAAGSVGKHSNLSIKSPRKRAAPTSIQLCQKARKKPRLSPCLSAQKSTQRADHPKPPQQGPGAKTLQPCKEPQLPPIPQRPCQPIRMLFKRLEGGQWSCKLLTTPSVPPAAKPAVSCSEPCHLPEDRGTPSQGALSVLQEDLQLSSSSDESDAQ